MRVIHRYIGQEFLRNFGVTLLVLTFVMCIGSVIRAIDLLSRGVSGDALAKSFVYIIPYILTFTLPIALIVSALLLFNRLSQDGELTAMKACGLSMWTIASPVVLIAAVVCGLSVFNNSVLAPWSHYAERKLFSSIDVVNPVELLVEGQFIRDFPGLVVYVGNRNGNDIKDVILYEVKRGEVQRKVRADAGKVTLEKEDGKLLVELFNARIAEPDSADDNDLTRYVNSSTYVDRIDISDLQSNGTVTKRRRDYSLGELVTILRRSQRFHSDMSSDDLKMEKQIYLVETHQRLTLGFSCLPFALLGIGLGIRPARKDTSIGIILCLVIIFVNYFFIILSQSLAGHPDLNPELIQWIPLVVGQGLGLWLIRFRN